MASLQPLETLGYTPAFFKFPLRERDGHQFTYYTFEENTPSRQPSSWDIIGVRQRAEPFLLEIRFLFIDEEALDWKPFEALRDAGNLFNVNAPKLRTLIHFFEEALAHDEMHSAEHALNCFHPLGPAELLQFHAMPLQSEQLTANFYRYLPDEHVQSNEYISLMRFPRWSIHRGANQPVSLEFATFERRRLDDPQFDPFDAPEWLGHMTFDQQALSEFVVLLKRHSYEQFVKDSRLA